MTFNGIQKVIILSETGTITVSDLYAQWKQWVLQGVNSKYLPAFKVIGGEEISSGVYLSATYFLTNGWRIRPAEKNHQLNVSGNLYVEEGGVPFIQTLGNFNVLINLNTSNIVNTVSTNNSGGSTSTSITNQDKQEIADKIKPYIDDVRDEVVPKLNNILGLLQHNFRLSDQKYNSKGNLMSAKIKIYSSSDDCDNDVNALNTYNISAGYDENERLIDYRVKEHGPNN